jgi:hypothetical protein
VNVAIRQKIEAALSANAAKPGLSAPPQPPPAAGPNEIADRIFAGERVFSLKDAMAMTGFSYNTLYQHLKGKPGWLRSPGGAIRITETLLRSYVTELAARGRADAA